MDIKTLIEQIDLRFTSGNEIPVSDVRLTREEWEMLKPYSLPCGYVQFVISDGSGNSLQGCPHGVILGWCHVCGEINKQVNATIYGG